MKRWIFWSSASVLTFLFGCAVVFVVSIISSPITQDRPLPIIANETEATKAHEFVPEYTDLPNLTDIAPSSLTTDLVDVREAENEYRKSEMVAKSGEPWLALFERQGRFELTNHKVKIGLHHRSTDPDYEDWYRFQFPAKNNPVQLPIFILRKIDHLKPGPVETHYQKPPPSFVDTRDLPVKSMARGYRESFSLGSEEYTFRVTSGTTKDGTEVNVLVLEAGNSSQVVTYNTYYKDSSTLYDDIGELLWVGDLDRDGKLDFYLSEFGYEKGGFGSSLFLSSAAENDQLVKLVVSFGTSGC